MPRRPGAARPSRLPNIGQSSCALHKEAEIANATMTEQHQPHYYARLKASENRGIPASQSASNSAPAADGEDDRRRPWSVEKTNKRQDWHNLDMSGQGLRVLAPALFSYEHSLQELYIASNRLTFLPADIGRLPPPAALGGVQQSHY